MGTPRLWSVEDPDRSTEVFQFSSQHARWQCLDSTGSKKDVPGLVIDG